MSYILDALQRAEQERERSNGAVPGLQTRAVTAITTRPSRTAVLKGRWLFVAMAALLVVIVITGLMLRRTQPEMTAPVGSVLRADASVAAANPTPIASTEPLKVTPSTSPVEPAPVRDPVAIVPAPVNRTTPAIPPTPKAAASATATPTAVLPFLKDLPEGIRRQIPPMTISGVVYSENPAQRLLLVNGQVLTQGSPAATDVVLDEIHPRSSDFTFKGTRFRVGH